MEWVTGATPELESAMDCGEVAAVLTTVAAPLALPTMVGSKMALKLVD
jgi:hypothetical protein